MEPIYSGSALINDDFDTLEIIIPSKKNWFVIIFMSAWLCGWVIGELFAIGAVTGLLFGRSVGSLFILFWLIGWTAGGVMVIRMLLWNIAGKEIATIGKGVLTLVRKGDLFSRPKTYDLKEVKNIRVMEEPNNNTFFAQRNDRSPFTTKGTIRFDYGMKTIKFGAGIDDAEANYILNRLDEKHIISRPKT